MEDDKSIGVHGSHLAEVFNIQINKINNGFEKCEVYGTIRVEDNQGTLNLYNRCLENAECVYQSGSLSLIAKERPIDASSSFEVIFDLKEKSGNEFIKNSFFVDVNNIDILPFNEKCRIAEVGGKMGGAVVNYAVYQAGVLACILTHFVKENDTSNSEGDYVHGNLVTTHCDEFGVKEDTRVLLFQSIIEKAVQLKTEDQYEIPLTRDFVVVPAYCSIRVEGDLHFRLSDGLVESIKISEQLPAHNQFREVKNLKGKYGRMKFSLLWRNIFNYGQYRHCILSRPSRF